jgi:hypothetical protein
MVTVGSFRRGRARRLLRGPKSRFRSNTAAGQRHDDREARKDMPRRPATYAAAARIRNSGGPLP